MIKSALVFLFLAIFPASVFAQSSASVKLNNNASSSSNSEVKSSTDIRVETNGNVTTYSSDETGDIEVNAKNGESQIKVNGQVVSGNTTQNPSQVNQSPTPEPTENPEDEDEDEIDNSKNIFEIFEDIFRVVFSLFA